ncbi:MAG: beta-ketoacyl-ACP synthase II [Anaerolineales bacterium]
MRKKVVITGLGSINPLGNNVQETWQSVLAGRSGIGRITRFDASDHSTQFAGEVKGFDPQDHFGHKEARRLDRFSQFAAVATGEALANAEFSIGDDNRDRVGIVVGTGVGGISTALVEADVLRERGPGRISPFMVPMMLPDTAAGQLAIFFGARGPNLCVTSACATGTNAIGEATEIIRRGAADVMLAGGAEAVLNSLVMAGFANMGALSKRNNDPQRASRPFDANRDGFVAGEGAAILVLESEEHAVARGARIYAEVKGYSLTNDAFHISAPAANGAGAAHCMHLALEDSGLQPSDIGYLNAHGTSTRLNDKSETAAIKAVFGERAYDTPVSSTKSMHGHLLGAAGALEAIMSVMAIHHGVLPATINYETPDPECDLDYVPNTTREAEVENVMSNSFGFGGHNACLVLGRYHNGHSRNGHGPSQ